jgi:hypothetical protein
MAAKEIAPSIGDAILSPGCNAAVTYAAYIGLAPLSAPAHWPLVTSTLGEGLFLSAELRLKLKVHERAPTTA